MKKILLFYLLLNLPVIMFSQEDIRAELIMKNGFSPFEKENHLVFNPGEREKVLNVPSDMLEYSVREMILDFTGCNPISLYVLTGGGQNGGFIIIPDLNGNLCFDDDPILRYPALTVKE